MSPDSGTPAPYVLCCPDKFRDSIDAELAADALAAGFHSAGLIVRKHPLADGGEGTLDAVLRATEADVQTVKTKDAIGRSRPGRVALLPDGSALVEAAEAIGLAMLAPGERDALRSTSAGLGSLIRAAFDLGARTVTVGVGGTATADGGIGAIRELGATLLDDQGEELEGTAADLNHLAQIDPGGLDRRAHGRIKLVLDACAPLTGPDGAARLFAPQKGASRSQVEQLEQGLGQLAATLGLSNEQRLSVGTGGGLAAPFVALAGARLSSGTAYVHDMTRFASAVSGARLCVTGEGRIDRQTLLGKTVLGVVRVARERGVPVVAVGGEVTEHASELYDEGITALLGIAGGPRPLERALPATCADLRRVGRALGGLVVGT